MCEYVLITYSTSTCIIITVILFLYFDGKHIDTRCDDVDTRGDDVDTRGDDVDTRGDDVDTRGDDVDTRGDDVDIMPFVPQI